jgi:glycosyltransferase involved in cell wall biosynthesis
VIVPSYQEEAALPGTLRELEALSDCDVVVVDDGSTDGTARVAADAGVSVVRLPFNLGVGAAVRAGLRVALERGYQRAVVFDADGQHDAADVTRLLAALDAGAAMAVGSRFAEGSDGYRVGATRRQAQRLLHRIVAWSTGVRFTDTTSGFRAFDRPVIELLARQYPVEFLADTVEVLIMVCRAGYQVVEVPVAMRQRAAGVPSTRRMRLVFNYLRLLVGITASASRHRPSKAAGP